MDTSNPYQAWMEARQRLKDAQNQELELRNFICAMHLEEGSEGARTYYVNENGNEYKVVATAKLNRSLDANVLDTLWEELSEVERNAVQYKPSLRMAHYKQLEAEGSILTEAVTVKPAQSSLVVEVLDVSE